MVLQEKILWIIGHIKNKIKNDYDAIEMRAAVSLLLRG